MPESPLAVGADAPLFSAPLVTPDGEVEETALGELLGEKPVLLAFYTNDFSPDCVNEWCSFRDYDWFATGERVQVVGVSRSRTYTHKKFIDYLDLGFPLYTDRDLSIAESYGVKYRAFKIAARAKRSVFFIDRDGVIKYRWVGEHPLDPTRDSPPLGEIQRALEDVLGPLEEESFGFK
ncbi:redoxin domain-containing protein [Salarchaeum japonicum]|uniref:thioredoxin-dependent peroxiredoxin n=1 Tax=Salarchaeum japonicum TaxID=555573 RepID=A0AAV3T1E5_9EURY|nr:redoxin domain-containing protein [Salarchaeum japonicum]